MDWIIKITTTAMPSGISTEIFKVNGEYDVAMEHAESIRRDLQRAGFELLALSIKRNTRAAYMRDYMRRRRDDAKKAAPAP